MLALPQPPSTSSGWPKKKAVYAKPLEITDNYFLQGMKGSAEENKKKEEKKVEGKHRAKERFEKRREKVGARTKETGKRKIKGEEIQGETN